MPDPGPRIVLLHATQVAVTPTHQAFAAIWPEAELVDLLDSGLTIDRGRTTELTPALIDRFVALAEYGHSVGARGILVTCSAFGPAIERVAEVLPIPVVKPNESMFRTALAHGDQVAMLATFAPSVSSMTDEFTDMAGTTAQLDTFVVDEAIDALRRGDGATHDRLVAAGAAGLTGYDAIMLAHFSTARSAAAVRTVVGSPVITAPEAAVRALRDAMTSAD